MDAYEAIEIALDYIKTALGSHLEDLGLEEVVRQDGEPEWAITIGFAKRWHDTRAVGTFPDIIGPVPRGREYKVIEIYSDGSVASMKIRKI